MGTVTVGETNDTIMRGVQCLSFYSIQIQTASSSKKWKKRAKNEKSRFAKNTFFFFLRVHELDIILGVNMDRKNRVGKFILNLFKIYGAG